MLTGFDAIAVNTSAAGTAIVGSAEDMIVNRVWIGPGQTFTFHACAIGGEFNPYGHVNNDSGVIVTGANVTLSACTVAAGRGMVFPGGLIPRHGVVGGYAVVCSAPVSSPSVVTISGCRLDGSRSVPGTGFCGFSFSPGGPAIIFGSNDTVRITDSVIAAGFDIYANPVPAILNVVGSPTLEYDASATFLPPTNLGTTVFLPGTGGQGSAPGGVMTCRVESGPSLPAALVASLGLRPPTVLPEGPAWVDPNAFVVLTIGVTDPAGNLNATIPIPGWAPRGLPIVVQSVAAPGTGGPLTAGTPAVLHVR